MDDLNQQRLLGINARSSMPEATRTPALGVATREGATPSRTGWWGVASRLGPAGAVGALLSVALVGCGPAGTTSAGRTEAAGASDPAGDPNASTAGPSAGPEKTDTATSSASVDAGEVTGQQTPERRALEREITDGGKGFVIDGVTGAVPDGYVESHVRAFYVYLGTNEGEGHVEWLSVAAPAVTRIAPGRLETMGLPAPDLPAEPAPPDLRRALDERGVPVHEWGELSVDGVMAPVITVEGHVELCASPPAGLPLERADNCRYNDPNQFYVLIPYPGGTLVVEGAVKDEAMSGEVPTAEEMTVVLDELRSWAASIELP